ncbi:MAG TPA: 2-oxoacid:acceptor oxidoreductase subunit alpha [Gemmatimonadaceae bacterium]|jgi:2-oxoglutarate ferredoxin oxidoreductase subunit alpha
MTSVVRALRTSGQPEPRTRINDFAFKIASVNGTGSSSANDLIKKAIFRMGIPVSGKNLFPSNIQGLPTWYEIRVNRDGHTARTPDFDLLVAMNPATYARDLAEVRPGGWLLHDSTWPLPRKLVRDDVKVLGVPLAALCNEKFGGSRERILMKNIAYTGALAAFLDMDMSIIEQLLGESYSKKKTLLDSNFLAVKLGYDYAREHYECPLPIRLERMDATADSILIDGNTAGALGCIYAGATVAAWYPITPSTSMIDAFQAFARKLRRDPETGKARVAILQAEDELSAVGMVLGANWVGARAFTSTSGPGISLMSEFIGLAYYAEIPAVIFDIQRTGPSTGMPTRTQQGDLLLCAYASHGDTKHLLLFPADPGECFDLAVRAFDLAERFQTPVFVLSDLDIGMNDWVVPRLKWDDSYRPDRGKVLNADDLGRIERFFRYVDTDGDGVTARTLPGIHPKGAFFTRGSGHNEFGAYTEDAKEYAEVMLRLSRKALTAAQALPRPEIRKTPGANVGIVSVGGCHRAVLEAMEKLAERGIPTDYMRVRAFPFVPEVRAFLESYDRIFVVEQNRDAQLASLLALETGFARARLGHVGTFGGMPLSARDVVESIMKALEWRAVSETSANGGPHVPADDAVGTDE